MATVNPDNTVSVTVDGKAVAEFSNHRTVVDALDAVFAAYPKAEIVTHRYATFRAKWDNGFYLSDTYPGEYMFHEKQHRRSDAAFTRDHLSKDDGAIKLDMLSAAKRYVP